MMKTLQTKTLEDYKPELKDSIGRYRTASLFHDQYNTNVDRTKYPPIFTLKTEDFTKGDTTYISFKRVYMEHQDPTGYSACMALLGEWDHWLKLSKAPWFQEYLDHWNTELEIKMTSEALVSIAEEAKTGKGSSKTSAAAYIAEKKWLPKRGRPTNAEVEGEKKKAAKVEQNLTDDLERLGLTTPQGLN